jgi:hypothetical protein
MSGRIFHTKYLILEQSEYFKNMPCFIDLNVDIVYIDEYRCPDNFAIILRHLIDPVHSKVPWNLCYELKYYLIPYTLNTFVETHGIDNYIVRVHITDKVFTLEYCYAIEFGLIKRDIPPSENDDFVCDLYYSKSPKYFTKILEYVHDNTVILKDKYKSEVEYYEVNYKNKYKSSIPIMSYKDYEIATKVFDNSICAKCDEELEKYERNACRKITNKLYSTNRHVKNINVYCKKCVVNIYLNFGYIICSNHRPQIRNDVWASRTIGCGDIDVNKLHDKLELCGLCTFSAN